MPKPIVFTYAPWRNQLRRRIEQAAGDPTSISDPGASEEIAHRVRKSSEEEERIDQRNLLLSSSRCKSRLIKVEQTGQ